MPSTGSTTGPIWVDGSCGYPTARLVTASASWRRNRSDVPTDPTRITSDAAEHFWPALPNALFTTSATARSRSALGVTTMAFLPLVSASSGRSAFHERNSAAVSKLPVRMTRPTSGAVISCRPRSRADTSTSVISSRGTPASQIASASTAPERSRLPGGLEQHGAAGGERGEHAAPGDRDREVPRRRHDGHAGRLEHGAVDGGELARAGGVVVREVDDLADLDVGLGDGLAGLGGHDLDEPPAEHAEHLADPVEQLAAIGAGHLAPDRAGLRRPRDDRAQRVLARHRGGGDRRDAELRLRAAGQDAAGPLAVGGERRVGVRLVLEVARSMREPRDAGGPGCGAAPAARGRGRRASGEAVALALVDRGVVELEQAGHEVVAARVLLEAADQVADRGVELLRVHDGRVEQQPAVVARTASACAAAIPSSISISTRPVTPRRSASSQAKARSNRLWPATPMRTTAASSGVRARTSMRL